MPRVVRCSLIQATNVEPAEKSLAQIKKAMIDKHVGLIRQAAAKARRSSASRRSSTAPTSAPSKAPAGTTRPSRFPTGPRSSSCSAGERTGHCADRPHLRGRKRRRLLQHRRGDRSRGQVPGQVSQDPHPACGAGLLGEVLLPPRQPRLSRFSISASAKSASTSATTGISPKARAHSASTARRLSSILRRRWPA